MVREQISDYLNSLECLQWIKIYGSQLGMVVHSYITSTWEAEAGRSQVRGQPGVHSMTLSLKNLKGL
jgi:hypothetical protein